MTQDILANNIYNIVLTRYIIDVSLTGGISIKQCVRWGCGLSWRVKARGHCTRRVAEACSLCSTRGNVPLSRCRSCEERAKWDEQSLDTVKISVNWCQVNCSYSYSYISIKYYDDNWVAFRNAIVLLVSSNSEMLSDWICAITSLKKLLWTITIVLFIVWNLATAFLFRVRLTTPSAAIYISYQTAGNNEAELL